MDEAAALTIVREFRSLLERGEKALRDSMLYSGVMGRLVPDPYPPIKAEIEEGLYSVERIATEVDPELAYRIRTMATKGWPYGPCQLACGELVGILSSRVRLAPVLASQGPLQAAGLHPWVWQAAEGLWRDGHYPEAVRKAASRILDDELPDKLGVPRGSSGMGDAFSEKPPGKGSPRLRFREFPADSEDWRSAHEGAKFFGMGCEKGIRNLVTHGARKPDQQTALEMLAVLSVLARWVEEAEVVAEP